MSAQTIREFINRHVSSLTGLAALGAVLDARATGTPLDPTLEARLGELLQVLGASDVSDLSAKEAAQFLTEIRHLFVIDNKLMYADTRTTSWNHRDPELLQLAGDFSRGFARGLTAGVIPALDGLAARFAASDARFLDVGVGVAGLSIELAGLWPQLRITGIDVWQPSLALARANVANAGLSDRIELREQAAEGLTDDAAFDLAWLPLVFMPERIVPAAMTRTLAALKPGGWVVAGFANWDVPDALQRASWRLRTTMFGGPMWTVGRVHEELGARGFADARTLPTPPGTPVLVAARRPA